MYDGRLLKISHAVWIERFLMDRTVRILKKHAGRGRPLPISYCATGLRDCVPSTLYDLQVHIDA